MVLLDATAADHGVTLEADGLVGQPALPMLLGPDLSLHDVMGPLVVDVWSGELAWITAEDDGVASVDPLVPGEDIDADRVWVEATSDALQVLGELTGAEVVPGDEGGAMLVGRDLYPSLALAGDVEGVYAVSPVTPDDVVLGSDRPYEVRAGSGATRGADTFRRQSRAARPRWTPAAGSRVSAVSQVSAVLQGRPATGAPLATASASREVDRSARWVGLHGSGSDECLLLDAVGGYRLCSSGLDNVVGLWSGTDDLYLQSTSDSPTLAGATCGPLVVHGVVLTGRSCR